MICHASKDFFRKFSVTPSVCDIMFWMICALFIVYVFLFGPFSFSIICSLTPRVVFSFSLGFVFPLTPWFVLVLFSFWWTLCLFLSKLVFCCLLFCLSFVWNQSIIILIILFMFILVNKWNVFQFIMGLFNFPPWFWYVDTRVLSIIFRGYAFFIPGDAETLLSFEIFD